MNMKKRMAIFMTAFCCIGGMTIPALAQETSDAETGIYYTMEDAEVTDASTKDGADVMESEDSVEPLEVPEQQSASINVQNELEIQTLNEAYSLGVTVTPGEMGVPELQWEIMSGSEVIEIDPEAGTVTALKTGTAIVKISALNDPDVKPVECKITVENLLSGIYEDPTGRSENCFYYENGQIQHITNVENVQGKGIWYNLVKGQVVGNTVAENEYGWWYINNDGRVDFDYTGLAANSSGWWRIENGKVNFDFCGFTNNDQGWWYLEGGQIVFDKTEVIYGTVGGETAWWYVCGGRVEPGYTGLAANNSGWWQIENGKVDFDYNGFSENEAGWWYLEGGQIVFDRTGVIWGTVEGEAAWWYVEGGAVKFSDTVAPNNSGWWYIRNGKVDFNYTGIAANGSGWWRIVDGRVDFNCNSVEQNEYGWWYIRGGCVDFGYTGIAANNSGWWRIVNGGVDFNCNSVEQNEAGWWYIKAGKVDFSYTGVAANAYGWWRIVNGGVDFNCNSVEQNEYGWWYIRNGCVDFNYNGVGTNSHGAWYIRGGCVDFSYNGNVNWNGYNYTVVGGRIQTNGVDFNMYQTAQKQSSQTNYLLIVDTELCRVGVFTGSYGQWTPIAYWPCSPGTSATPTVKGSFTVASKGKVFGKAGQYSCWYYTQFYGNYLFHSVLYYPGSMTNIKDGRLGMKLSHGCVRLDINNAKWIWDTIPTGTKVYIY